MLRMTDLQPCPFCGSEDVWLEREVDRGLSQSTTPGQPREPHQRLTLTSLSHAEGL
jgi:hypothetical protein